MPNSKFSWFFPEYNKKITSLFYWLVILTLSGGLLTYTILEENFLFAILIIIWLVLLVLFQFEQPMLIQITLTNEGVTLHHKFYRYQDFASFQIIDNYPLASDLYLTFHNHLNPNLVIPLDNQDPKKIQFFLKKHLPESSQNEISTATSITKQILGI